MKNKLRKMLLLTCAVMLAFTLTACGGSGNDSKTADDAQTEDDSTAGDDTAAKDDASADDTDEDDGTVTGKFASIQDFIDSSIFKDQLESQIAENSDSQVSITFTAEENKLICNYTINDPDIAAVIDKASLESTLESQASSFESVAEILPEAIDVENPIMVVRYLDTDGNELVSKEFTATSNDNTANNTEQ